MLNITIVLTCFIFQVKSQIISKPKTITTNDGLGFRHVNFIAQDVKGLIWIATPKGIERYDGNEFITFNTSNNANVKCPITRAKQIETKYIYDDVILVLADDKLFSIELCNNSVTEFKLPKEYEGKINNIFISKKEKLYISVIKNNSQILLSHYENKFNKISTIKVDKYFKNTIQEDKDGNIWLSNINQSLVKFSPEGTMLSSIKHDSFIWFDSKFYFNEFFIDTDENDFYVFPKSKNEIRLYNEKDKTYKTLISNLSSPIYNAVKDSQGNLWINTKTELWRYNKYDKENKFQNYTSLLQNELQYTAISHLFIDKVNVLWVSTNNGIIKIPLSKQLFDKVLFTKDVEWGNEMRGIAQMDDRNIYTFCENGASGFYKIIKPLFDIELIYAGGSKANLINGINYLKYYKKDNKLWALNSHFLKIDPESNIVEQLPVNLKGITSNDYHNPFSLLKDGNLILGYNCSVLAICNPKEKTIKRIGLNKKNAESILTEFFHEDKENNIWIGTNQGVIIISKDGDILQEINENTEPSLSNNNCLSILEDSYNRIWIGTFGGGINILERKSNGKYAIKIIDNKAGLCDDNVTAILEDNTNNTWVSTYNGISRIDNKTGNIQNFYAEDGLTNNEFNYTSSLKDSEGNLWFGGLNGITIINPNKAMIQNPNPPLVLTSFSSYDTRTNKTFFKINEIDEKEKFVISPYTSWFQFNWSLPNYFNNDKNKYYTLLDGLENSWSFHGNNPFIRYNNLKPGEYTLRVKGTDSKGNPSISELAINFIVEPFFYQTWWFTILWILGVGGLFFLLYRYNLNKKLAMERMRTQIASDLHDEVGSMLSGLAMQSELLQADSNPINSSRFQNIADLSRNVVGKMRDLVWSIDSRSDTAQDLLDKMYEKLATLLGPKDIAYRIEIGDLSLGKHLSVNIRQQLYLIFNEALTNIVRHSNANEVIVNIGNVGANFVMSIKDNGSNIDTQKKSTGMGLNNLKMRAKKINAICELDTADGFEIKIVMKKI